MKLLFGLLLIVGGLCGIAISFSSDIVASSTLPIFNELRLSLALGFFFIVALISGVQLLFSSN